MTEDEVRVIIRQEIASLAGKALRRTQDLEFTRSSDRNLAMEVANEQMAQFWGEVLAEYNKMDDDEFFKSGKDATNWPRPKASPETSGIAADYADSAE